MKIKLAVGNKEFTATLSDNETSWDLVKRLPMTVTMKEHNGNEKYCNLPDNFPGRAINPDRIQAGDLMIWSSSTLVLFYTGSSTSYSYIRLGHIDNISGLRDALGRESVEVRFELIKKGTE